MYKANILTKMAEKTWEARVFCDTFYWTDCIFTGVGPIKGITPKKPNICLLYISWTIMATTKLQTYSLTYVLSSWLGLQSWNFRAWSVFRKHLTFFWNINYHHNHRYCHQGFGCIHFLLSLVHTTTHTHIFI